MKAKRLKLKNKKKLIKIAAGVGLWLTIVGVSALAFYLNDKSNDKPIVNESVHQIPSEPAPSPNPEPQDATTSPAKPADKAEEESNGSHPGYEEPPVQ